MKKFFFLISIYFLFMINSKLMAKAYIGVGPILEEFSTQKMKSNNAKFLGNGYQVTLGNTNGVSGFEVFYTSSKLKTTINHDDNLEDINLNKSTYGYNLTFFINTVIYFNFGYLYHNNVYKFENEDLTQSSLEQIIVDYDIYEKTKKYEGLSYGINARILNGKNVSLDLKYSFADYNIVEGTSQVLALTFNFKFDFNLKIKRE